MVYGIGFSENNNLAAVSWTGVTSIGLCYTLYSVQLGKTFLKYVITSSSMITPIQGRINWLFSPICNQWDTHTHTHTHTHSQTCTLVKDLPHTQRNVPRQNKKHLRDKTRQSNHLCPSSLVAWIGEPVKCEFIRYHGTTIDTRFNPFNIKMVLSLV